MLKDSEIIEMKDSENYEKVTQEGLNKFVKDLIKGKSTDLKPNLSTMTKILFGLMKSRYIRKELYQCSVSILEKLINFELAWKRDPNSVKNICESESIDFIWMRYDEERVNSLFQRCKFLIEDPNYRTLVKSFSTIVADKNIRLKELQNELEILHNQTIFSLQKKGLFNNWLKISGELFYKQNEDEITQKFLGNSINGNMGMLPTKKEDETN